MKKMKKSEVKKKVNKEIKSTLVEKLTPERSKREREREREAGNLQGTRGEEGKGGDSTFLIGRLANCAARLLTTKKRLEK